MISNTVILNRPGRIFAAALVAALGVGLSQSGWGQSAAPIPLQSGAQVSGVSSVPAAAPNAPAAPAGKGSINQGISFHGYWVINVRNPDGTLAVHREFENSIQAGGAAYLLGLMAGYTVPSDYEIFLQSTGITPCVPPGSLQGCVIVRSLTTTPGSNSCPEYFCAVGLTYTHNLSYSVLASNSFVMTGSMTANRAGTIDYVSTYAGSCPVQFIGGPLSTTSPAACNAAAGGTGINALSGAAITSVPVANGQIVQVIVTISFS